MIINNEIAPLKKDLSTDSAKMYEQNGIALLGDEFELFVANVYLRSLEADETGLKLNFRIIELFCEREEMDILEMHAILSAMKDRANKERSKKWR